MKWAGDLTRRELARMALLAWLGSGTRQTAAPAAPLASAADAGARWDADFPMLGQVVNGQPLAYLDSAATTQRPAAVLEAVLDYYRRDNANPGSALHTLARRAHERYEGARRTIATFINAVQPDEVVWVRGTTEGINLVANAWATPATAAG